MNAVLMFHFFSPAFALAAVMLSLAIGLSFGIYLVLKVVDELLVKRWKRGF